MKEESRRPSIVLQTTHSITPMVRARCPDYTVLKKKQNNERKKWDITGIQTLLFYVLSDVYDNHHTLILNLQYKETDPRNFTMIMQTKSFVLILTIPYNITG